LGEGFQGEDSRMTEPGVAGGNALPASRRRAGYFGIALAGLSIFFVVHEHVLFGGWATRPFWQDESMHGLAVIETRSFPDLLRYGSGSFQPVLDYFLRKYVWSPIFGHQERGQRLPSYFYYLAMLIGGIFLSARTLKREGHPEAFAVFGAFLIGLWMVHKPIETWHAYEARHYSFVAMMSLFWFWLSFASATRYSAWWWLASLAFANTHFFAIPMIAALGTYDAAGWLRKRDWRMALAVFAGISAVCAATVAVNIQGWNAILHNPPGAHSDFWGGIRRGLVAWWEYNRYLSIRGVQVVAIWAALLFALGRRDVRRFLFLVLVCLPLFLIFMSAKSSMPFHARYYTPFFGAGFVTLVMGLDLGRRLALRAYARVGLQSGTARLANYALLAMLFVAFKAGPAIVNMAGNYWDVRTWPVNGSPTYRLYEVIKSHGPSVLLVSENDCNIYSHKLYLNHIGAPFRGEVHMAFTHGKDSNADIRGDISRFLRDHPGALIVLDQTNCSMTCRTLTAFTLPGGARVWKAPDDSCAWFVAGARTLADVRVAARRVGFRSLAWWYGTVK